MFGVYFGKYLQDVGVLTDAQYQDIIETSRTARLKMGMIAINEGFMTAEQAEEVNTLQSMRDARFGDIAIEKGYLTKEQLDVLLKKQGDSYLLFIQTVIEKGYLSREDIQKHLKLYKKSEHFSSLDIDALKSSDIDRILPIFIRDVDASMVIKDYLALLARNMVRFVDNKIMFGKLQKCHVYTGNYIANQGFTGTYEMFIGLSGEGNKVVGETFGKEEFEALDEDCLDAVCEFINVTNGLFATKLSQEDTMIDMVPPEMYVEKTTISTDGMMYVLPVIVRGKSLDVVICMETRWSIE